MKKNTALSNRPVSEPLLSVVNLKTCFKTRYGTITAVDGVSLDVLPGECLGVVGESGSGKSVTFASVMGLVKAPGWIDEGEVLFEGEDLRSLSRHSLRLMAISFPRMRRKE